METAGVILGCPAEPLSCVMLAVLREPPWISLHTVFVCWSANKCFGAVNGPKRPVDTSKMPRRSFPEPVTRASHSILWRRRSLMRTLQTFATAANISHIAFRNFSFQLTPQDKT